MQGLMPREENAPYSNELMDDLYGLFNLTLEKCENAEGKTPRLQDWYSVTPQEQKAVCEVLLRSIVTANATPPAPPAPVRL